LIFVPFYIKYLGPEAYGLIGVFASFQTILSLMDSGLSTTLNRELARLNVIPNSSSNMRNLVKTLGTGYWVLAIFIGFIAILLSPILAHHWVQPKELSVTIIQNSFLLLSISLIFQFPIGLYTGGLLGLQRQVLLNILRISFSTIKNLGALLILIFYSQSILYFFSWFLFVSILQVITFKYALWHYIPKSKSQVFFKLDILKNISRFAIGMSGITLTSILFSQMDKIILSKILPLDQFGYYSIASTIGLLIFQVIGPITQSYFPKFTELICKNNIENLKHSYHQSCQLISVVVIPATLMLVFFSKELMYIWTQNDITVANTWIIVAIFSLGSGLNGLINIHYHLILAYGWVKLPLYQNSGLLIIMIPLTIILTKTYGTVGGALSWLTINLIYLFLTPYLLHRKFLKNELKSWWINDILPPIIVTISLFIFFKFVFNPLDYLKGRWISLLYLVLLGICILFINSLFLKKLDLKSLIKPKK